MWSNVSFKVLYKGYGFFLWFLARLISWASLWIDHFCDGWRLIETGVIRKVESLQIIAGEEAIESFHPIFLDRMKFIGSFDTVYEMRVDAV